MQEALNHAHVEANLHTALHWNTPTSTTPAPRPFAVRADTTIQRTSHNATQPATTQPTQCTTTCEQDTTAQTSTGVNVYLDDSCHQGGQTRSDATRAAQIWTCAAPAAPAPGTLHPLQPGTAANTATGGAASVRLGLAGEAAVRGSYDIGDKATAVINGRTRIFDGLNDQAVSEVKNVGRQSLTLQLRDDIDYAQANGLRFDLYVRDSTQLSGPLVRADLDPTNPLNIRYIP